jgi:hypothetical protein
MDFKLQRRNSLQQEVDGVWPGLEEEEDTFVEHRWVLCDVRSGVFFDSIDRSI